MVFYLVFRILSLEMQLSIFSSVSRFGAKTPPHIVHHLFVAEVVKHTKYTNLFRIFNLPFSSKGGKSFHFTFNFPCKQDTMELSFSLPLFLCLCLLFTEKSTCPVNSVSLPGQTALIRIFWSIPWITPPWLNCFFSYRLLFLWELMSRFVPRARLRIYIKTIFKFEMTEFFKCLKYVRYVHIINNTNTSTDIN